MAIIKNDNEFVKAYSACSPNLKRFIEKLNDKDKLIDWDCLDRNGFRQSDGSYFRILGSLRTFKEQIALYKQGRKGVKYETQTLIFQPKPYKGNRYILKDRGQVVGQTFTLAWCGESFHNWGLAFDMVLRSVGEVKFVVCDGVKMSLKDFYEKIGLLRLATMCGISWGGSWASYEDVAHWEDTKYPIPEKGVHCSANANFEFIRWWYEEQGFDRTTLKPSETALKISSLIVAGLLIVGFLIWKRK